MRHRQTIFNAIEAFYLPLKVVVSDDEVVPARPEKHELVPGDLCFV